MFNTCPRQSQFYLDHVLHSNSLSRNVWPYPRIGLVIRLKIARIYTPLVNLLPCKQRWLGLHGLGVISRTALGSLSGCPRLILANTPVANIQNTTLFRVAYDQMFGHRLS